MFVVAHVSDTHFGNDVQEPSARCAAVMDHLLAMRPRPDLLVVSGDVADHGLDHEYAAARAWLDRWPGALAVCPGNHDVREAFVAGIGRPARSVVEAGGYRFVMLDSLVDAVAGERVDEGRLGADQLAWLDAELARSTAPAFVVLHHPPTTIGLELMDPIRLMDGAGGGDARRPRAHDEHHDVRRPAVARRRRGRLGGDGGRRAARHRLVRRPAGLRAAPGRRQRQDSAGHHPLACPARLTSPPIRPA
jgi:3',5'-cyclic AMP phosphodiesterase CpdA